jgi:hypothetical protein
VVVLLGGLVSALAGGGGGGGGENTKLKPKTPVEPELAVSAPAESTTVTGNSFEVKGKVTPPDAEVTVNGRRITTESGGSFTNVFNLAPGENEIEIIASNGGEKVEYSRVVTRKLTAEEIAAQKEADQQEQQAQQQEGQQQQQPAQQEAENKPQPPPQYTVGQTATVGNVVWTVTDAFLTNQLRSGFGTQKRGRFVVVDFTFTNNRPEEVTLDPQLHMTLKDSQGREFGTDPDAWEFVPVNRNIFLEPVNPGVSTSGRVIYQVAPDATGFSLTVDDVEFWEDKSAVFNLSNIRPRAY